eukprot:1348332-Amorphochlora_amoeboformis.AAC.2
MEQADVPALVCRAKLAEQARRYMGEKSAGDCLQECHHGQKKGCYVDKPWMCMGFERFAFAFDISSTSGSTLNTNLVSWRVLMANETQLSNKVAHARKYNKLHTYVFEYVGYSRFLALGIIRART